MPPSPAPVGPAADGFAVVGVRTTGLDARRDRIVQLAVATADAAGRLQDTWSTLVDPGRDPGPVALHGLTADRLADAPGFAAVEATAAGLLRGRVLVAHDASFGWRALAAETGRASGAVRVSSRLCTMALARRLELDLPDLTLASLAAHCGVEQTRPHDAAAEVRTLVEVLCALLPQAAEVGALLPLSACAPAADDRAADGLAPRVRSPWDDPGPWRPDSPLVQGARFAVTGPTGTPRPELYDRALVAGLVPMNSVSGRTRFLVSNNRAATTGDARAAAAHGVPTISESAFLRLLGDVRPGVPVKAVAAPVGAGRGGPLAGVRVLVLGGPHERAIAVRAEAESRGATVAVRLTGSVTHIVELDGAGGDRRLGATLDLPRLDPDTLAPTDGDRADRADRADEPAVARLRRGEVIDLPEGVGRWEAFLSWPADGGTELDVVALVTGDDHRVLSDDHFAFFNNLLTPRGEVELTVDTAGEARAVLDLDELAGAGGRVVLAAATTDGGRFGDVGPVELLLTDSGGAPVARGVCDAATTEQTLLVAEVYRRGERWRIRSVGQGYDDGLRELAVRYGVDAD